MYHNSCLHFCSSMLILSLLTRWRFFFASTACSVTRRPLAEKGLKWPNKKGLDHKSFIIKAPMAKPFDSKGQLHAPLTNIVLEQQVRTSKELLLHQKIKKINIDGSKSVSKIVTTRPSCFTRHYISLSPTTNITQVAICGLKVSKRAYFFSQLV